MNKMQLSTLPFESIWLATPRAMTMTGIVLEISLAREKLCLLIQSLELIQLLLCGTNTTFVLSDPYLFVMTSVYLQ